MSALTILASFFSLLFTLLLTVSFSHPQSHTFRLTGSMNVARFGNTITLLPSGKVLVAGGTQGSNTLESAELYDPSTGAWTFTGSMNTPRKEHKATLLNNGKVLIVGGTDFGNNPLASAELYDPITGTWSLTGSTSIPRRGHTATLLSSGKVLVAGGTAVAGDLNTASAELYDPTAGTFTLTGSMNQGRRGHQAALLLDGKVLVVDGGQSSGPFSSAELYDPTPGTWSFTGSIQQNRGPDPAATMLLDGRVLVVGGLLPVSGDVPTATAELYNPPPTGSFSFTGSMGSARYIHTATLLSDGKILVAGGRSGETGRPVSSSAEIYEPLTESWTATESLNVARYAHTATLLDSGEVLVAGGVDASFTAVASAELFALQALSLICTGLAPTPTHLPFS